MGVGAEGGEEGGSEECGWKRGVVEREKEKRGTKWEVEKRERRAERSGAETAFNESIAGQAAKEAVRAKSNSKFSPAQRNGIERGRERERGKKGARIEKRRPFLQLMTRTSARGEREP